MAFWGFDPDADAEQNRFIPPEPIEPDWVLQTAKIQVAPTETGFCLIDNSGFILTLYELTEILTAIKPFYDEVADRHIIQANEKHLHRQRDPHQRISLPPSGPPEPGFVYLLQCAEYYKIGCSKKVDRRIKQLSTLPPFDLVHICSIQTDDMYQLEFELHQRFQHKRKRGEWFTLDAEDIEYIRSLAVRKGTR
ncbi:MAG: hypothetical protein GWN58_25880 [Anaerolineae bacterium]|nr:hypothetical protein [Anaerolineae bacterium]